ncbi:AAA family ATPase [Bradyrhizobium sp. 930_D9_N1_4]|uniref:AAA family ATPase n=1 Tax=Bradyrhizobium sp. 930_D9_N1_4 TaxID=3240374 RepID=UPI003F8A9CB2
MTSLRPPALIVFGGLPGTGKTTLSRKLAMRLAATYLRIDAIEQSLRHAGLPVGAMGYAVAHALAVENLRLGRIVVADCVNPVLASRTGWRQTALQNSAQIVEIEIVCTDLALHRQRVDNRSPDISGHELPRWDEIVNHHYEGWDREHLVLDTAFGSPDDLVEQAEAYVRGRIG